VTGTPLLLSQILCSYSFIFARAKPKGCQQEKGFKKSSKGASSFTEGKTEESSLALLIFAAGVEKLTSTTFGGV